MPKEYLFLLLPVALRHAVLGAIKQNVPKKLKRKTLPLNVKHLKNS
jgi:hypothetical protein